MPNGVTGMTRRPATGLVVLALVVIAPLTAGGTTAGPGPNRATPSRIEPVAVLVRGDVHVTATMECIDSDGGSQASVRVAQRRGEDRVVLGLGDKGADCYYPWYGTVDVPVSSRSGASFRTGRAFVIVADYECYRAGDDYICVDVPLTWREIAVRKRAQTPTAGGTAGVGAGAGVGSRPALGESSRDEPEASLTLLRKGRLKAGGAGAVVGVRARCTVPEGWYSYGQVVQVAVGRAVGRQGAGSTQAPAYRALPCDGEEHVLRVPLVSSSGFAFGPGRTRATAAFSVRTVDPSGRDVEQVTSVSRQVKLRS